MRDEDIRRYIKILKFIRTETGSVSVERMKSVLGSDLPEYVKNYGNAMSWMRRKDVESVLRNGNAGMSLWKFENNREESFGTLEKILVSDADEISTGYEEKVTTKNSVRYKVDYLLSIAFPKELAYLSLNLYASCYTAIKKPNQKVQVRIGIQEQESENDSAVHYLYFHKNYSLISDINSCIINKIDYILVDISGKYVSDEAFGEKVKKIAEKKNCPVFIEATGAVFEKELLLKDVNLLSGSTFAGALFLDDLIITGCIIDNRKITGCENHSVTVNFRNVRFSKDVSIINIKSVGHIQERLELSFEDAVFKSLPTKEKIEGSVSIMISDCALSQCKWNFFQTVLYQGKVLFKNMDMSDSKVEFSLSELDQIVFENINQMGYSVFVFKQAKLLELKKCIFGNPVTVENVEQFGIENCVNYSIITSSETWTFSNTNKEVHPLLEAAKRHDNSKSKNHRICREQYAILKKSFQDVGMYAAEDAALIQYMNYYSNNIFLCGVFWLLNLTGGYGTKPMKVLISLLCSGMISTLFQWLSQGKDKDFLEALYAGLANMLSFAGLESSCVILNSLYLVVGFLNWFLLGYFSVAVIRKILR